MTLKLLWFLPIVFLFLALYVDWTYKCYKAFKSKDSYSENSWEDWVIGHCMAVIVFCTLIGIISLFD